MDGISELAKMFKDREPIKYMGPIVGTVLSPPPEIKVQKDKKTILDKSHLVIGASVTDTIKEGDKVILIPSQDEQTYFLIDWAVRL